MTVEYPDVSHYQGYISLNGVQALVAKATQGVSYVDPLYSFYRNSVQSRPFAAYHWLDTTSATQQAVHCFGVVGPKTPLMIDDEQNVIHVDHTLEFVHAYRGLGGLVTLEYAPRWVWEASGKPDLRPLAEAGLSIVSSDYSKPYSDDGVGFRPYGGITPVVWQYTSSKVFANKKLDFNGFPGTLDELRAVFMGEHMATINQADWDALIWRMEAVVKNLPTVAGGPTKGEPNMLAKAVHDSSAAVSPEQLAVISSAAERGAAAAIDGATITAHAD